MNVKGQGALEYLLLIGGAVLVAAIVIALIAGIPTTTPNPQLSAGCAAQFSCSECANKALTGFTGTPCKAQFTDSTTAGTTAECTAALPPTGAKVFKACIPD